MRRLPVVAFVLAGFVLAGSFATAGRAADTPGERAARWLAGRQAPTGAVPEGGRPDEVAEAVASLVAGAAPATTIDKALTYVAERGAAQTTRGGHVSRVILGTLAAKRDPRSLGGVDYVARLEAAYNATTGTYDSGVYANGLAYLAKLAISGQLTTASRRYLAANQCSDGGFAHDVGCTKLPDVDTTAVVVRVLARDGSDPAALDRARTWLARAQNNDGGFPLDRGGITNTNSTALALLAIAELGAAPSDAPWRRDGGSPLDALLRLQTTTGGFRFVPGGSENDYATIQAVPAAVRFVPVSAGGTAAPAGGTRAPATTAAPRVAGSPATTIASAIVPTTVLDPAGTESVDDDRSGDEAVASEPIADESAESHGPLATLAAVVLAGVAYTAFEQRRRLGPR